MAGLFITFEGGEGVGKSTQIALLAKRLQQINIPIQITREPGAGVIGAKLRDILLHEQVAPKAELLLYLADRAQHLEEELRPWLSQSQVVLCDRFLDSSEVYQGFARKLGVEFVRSLHEWLLKEIWPNLTILLDMPASLGLQRVSGRQTAVDRLESENIKFHEKLRQGFLQQAEREPGRIKVVDANDGQQQVSDNIWRHIEPMIQKWRAN